MASRYPMDGWDPMADDYYDPQFPHKPKNGPYQHTLPGSNMSPQMGQSREYLNLYVRNVSEFATDDNLCRIFSHYGSVIEARVKSHKIPKKDVPVTKYAFVTVPDIKTAHYMIEMLHGKPPLLLDVIIARTYEGMKPTVIPHENNATGFRHPKLPLLGQCPGSSPQNHDQIFSNQPGPDQNLPGGPRHNDDFVTPSFSQFNGFSSPAFTGSLPHISNESLLTAVHSSVQAHHLTTGIEPKGSQQKQAAGGRYQGHFPTMQIPKCPIIVSKGQLPCTACGAAGNVNCPVCKAWYCSEDCRSNDWAINHKDNCVKFPENPVPPFVEVPPSVKCDSTLLSQDQKFVREVLDKEMFVRERNTPYKSTTELNKPLGKPTGRKFPVEGFMNKEQISTESFQSGDMSNSSLNSCGGGRDRGYEQQNSKYCTQRQGATNKPLQSGHSSHGRSSRGRLSRGRYAGSDREGQGSSNLTCRSGRYEGNDMTPSSEMKHMSDSSASKFVDIDKKAVNHIVANDLPVHPSKQKYISFGVKGDHSSENNDEKLSSEVKRVTISSPGKFVDTDMKPVKSAVEHPLLDHPSISNYITLGVQYKGIIRAPTDEEFQLFPLTVIETDLYSKLIKLRKTCIDSSEKQHDFKVDIGIFVAAYYRQDSSWQRAFVIKMESDGKCKVCFMDCGVVDTLDIQRDLKPLHDGALDGLPGLAMIASKMKIPEDRKSKLQKLLFHMNEIDFRIVAIKGKCFKIQVLDKDNRNDSLADYILRPWYHASEDCKLFFNVLLDTHEVSPSLDTHEVSPHEETINARDILPTILTGSASASATSLPAVKSIEMSSMKPLPVTRDISKYFIKDLPPQFKLNCGEDYRGIPTWINDMNKLSMQLYIDEDQIHELNSTLISYCEAAKSAGAKVAADLHIGELLCCYNKSYLTWYRVQVIDLNGVNNGNIQAIFIDFGNVDKVSLDDLLPFCAELGKFPLLCYSMNVDGVSPNHKESHDKFEAVVQGQQNLKVNPISVNPLVASVVNCKTELPVVQFEKSSTYQGTKHAAPQANFQTPAPIPKTCFLGVEVCNGSSVSPEKAKNLSQSPDGRRRPDSRLVENLMSKFNALPGLTASVSENESIAPILCQNGASNMLSHQSALSSNLQSSVLNGKEDIPIAHVNNCGPPARGLYFAWEDCLSVNLPIANDVSVVMNTKLMHPHQLFLMNKDEGLKHLEALVEMSSAIEEYCNHTCVKRFWPSIGEMCFALFEEDGAWYRAACISQTDDDQSQVIFVDYGNIAIVPRSNLRRMKAEFLQIPCLAVQCVMSDIKEDQVSAALCERLAQLLPMFQPFKVNVLCLKEAPATYDIAIPSVMKTLSQEGLLS